MASSASESISSDREDGQHHLYKVIVIGDYAVGKTSIIKRYTEGYFTPNYKLTIGVDFAVKVVEWEDETTISLQLWDVAGHERFGTMTSVYYKYAIAAVIVFDLSRPATFDAVLKWRDDVNSKVMLGNNEPIPTLLLANKSDLKNVKIEREELDKFCQENGFIGWFETSAFRNTGIDEAMKFLIGKILEVAKTNMVSRPEDAFRLGAQSKQIPSSGKQEQTVLSSCCNT